MQRQPCAFRNEKVGGFDFGQSEPIFWGLGFGQSPWPLVHVWQKYRQQMVFSFMINVTTAIVGLQRRSRISANTRQRDVPTPSLDTCTTSHYTQADRASERGGRVKLSHGFFELSAPPKKLVHASSSVSWLDACRCSGP